MLNVGFSEVGDVSVVTSSHSGLSVDHWADRATDKIISDLKTKKDDKVKEQKEKASTIGTDALNIFKGKGPTKGSLIRKLNIYVPPGADDFAGLLYTFNKTGKEGEAQMKFFEENIMTPFAKGINAYEAAKVALGKDYKELKNPMQINPSALIPLLVKSGQDLQKQINKLEKRIQKLEDNGGNSN